LRFFACEPASGCWPFRPDSPVAKHRMRISLPARVIHSADLSGARTRPFHRPRMAWLRLGGSPNSTHGVHTLRSFRSCRRSWRLDACFIPHAIDCHRPPWSCWFPRGSANSHSSDHFHLRPIRGIGPGFWAFRPASCSRLSGGPLLPWAFASSRFSDDRRSLAFHQADQPARWPGLVTLASRQPPETASGSHPLLSLGAYAPALQRVAGADA
jgi:hypothetical protein